MILPILAVIFGLAILVWSADKFVDGAVGIARYCGMSTLLIGMVIVGFGTSAPEMVVSALSAAQGNPQLALGNAYGSNIANVALILGCTALLVPIIVKKGVFRRDLPILFVVTLVSAFLLRDGGVSRADAFIMLGMFALVMVFNILVELRNKEKVEAQDPEEDEGPEMTLGKSIFWLLLGLGLLVGSSRLLVWGAVDIAHALGVSDLLIGLTVVAVGTSLPELASSIVAARKGEDDLAVGNIIGSNLFNTLMVVGIAGVIAPMESIDSAVIVRDVPVMVGLLVLLFLFGLPVRVHDGEKRGRINRVEGSVFLLLYIAYVGFLIAQATGFVPQF